MVGQRELTYIAFTEILYVCFGPLSYKEFTIPQLRSCFDKFSWTESLVRSFQRSGIDSRLSLNFFKAFEKK